jgi:hypothetical protein
MAVIGYMRNNLDQGADALALHGVDRLYQDGPLSPRDPRSGLTAALKSLRHGETLAVARLADLGRGIRALIGFCQELRQMGIHLIAVNEQIDTSDDHGWDFYRWLASLAEIAGTGPRALTAWPSGGGARSGAWPSSRSSGGGASRSSMRSRWSGRASCWRMIRTSPSGVWRGSSACRG